METTFRRERPYSKAHLLLLSKFLVPHTINDFAQSDWASVLGETGRQAIERFRNDGLLTEAGLNAQLGYKYKVSELKDMLKHYGLSVSGRKDDLIQRLIQVDPEGMKKKTAALVVWQCSESGKGIAEEFLFEENHKRKGVEQKVIECLRQRKFEEASLAVASFEAEQVFSRGLGIDWKHHDPAGDVATLKAIFNAKPRILKQLDDEPLEALRIGAGMMGLWGTNTAREWLPADLKTGLALDDDTAARMFLFLAIHQTSPMNYRQSGVVKSVEVLSAPNSCDTCKRLAGKKYKLDKVPELPYEHCTHDMGCRCTLVPVTEFG
jgi:hypothetical protein